MQHTFLQVLLVAIYIPFTELRINRIYSLSLNFIVSYKIMSSLDLYT